MVHTQFRKWISYLLPVFLILFMASAGFAQDEEKPFVEPGLILAPSEKPIFQWIAGFLFIVGCAGIAFKHPRRSHLD